MTIYDPLLVVEESKRRRRASLKARYKAGNPTAKGMDRTTGMHIPGDKEASKKYRLVLKKDAKEFPIDLGTLKQMCLDITRRHV
jgi:hypothetical protein